MLKIGMTPGEYITLGDDIRIVFSGGTGHHIHLLVDAPKDVKILRSSCKDSQDKAPYYTEKEQTSYLKKGGISHRRIG